MTFADGSTTTDALKGRTSAPDGTGAAAETFSLLSPRLLTLGRIGFVGPTILIGLVAFGLAAVAEGPVAVRLSVAAAVLALAVALTITVPAARYRRWRYRVTNDGIELRHGVLVRNESSIPHFRVQHVDVRQGVLQRRLGIVSLSISTASPATDAELPGLEPERAEAIRRLVLDRAEADDGV